MNTLTIIVIIIFFLFMMLGYKRGLFRSVFKIVLTGLSFVLAYFCAPMITTFLINSTSIDDIINNKIEEFIESKVEDEAEKQVNEALGHVDESMVNDMVDTIMSSELTRNEQVDFIYNMGLPELVTNSLMANNNDSMKSALGVSAFFDYIASYITYMIMNVLSFTLISLVLWLLSNLIFMAISFAVQLPIVGSINRVGGILFGAAEALLVVWAVFLVIAVCTQTSAGASLYNQITESAILKFLYDKNIFIDIITGLDISVATVLPTNLIQP